MKPLLPATIPESEVEMAAQAILTAWRKRDPAIMALVSDDTTEGEVYAYARKLCKEEQLGSRIFMNDVYQVAVRETPEGLVHLSIKRRDRQPCKDWRDFQEIKNQIVGPECEAVELYPAESRLVDGACQYHLWVVPDPAYRFPFGFKVRSVSETNIGKSYQRPFAKTI